MSVKIHYAESGDINLNTPLEPFYNALLPLLKMYGFTEEFPADMPSTDYKFEGYEFEFRIGEPPGTFNYRKIKEEPYAGYPAGRALVSDTLFHVETGEEMFICIGIDDISLRMDFEGEESEVTAIRDALNPVLAEYGFQSKKLEIKPSEGTRFKSSVKPPANPMLSTVDFDVLARKTMQSNGAMEDLHNLYGHAFALPQWHFIARGELPNVNPYVASNAEFAGGQHMVRAFTDTDRLLRFAQENKLTQADGGASDLSIPTDNIVDYLEGFIADGVHGVWFNSDTGSEGFFIPLQQLRPMREQLEKINWKNNTTDSPATPTESLSDPPETVASLSKLLEENAELNAGYDEENAFLSAIIGGSAEGMDMQSKEEKGVVISNLEEMFDSVRREYDMSPRLFEFFIELCLEKRKFIIPVLAFALGMQDEDKVRRLEQDEELNKELARWITIKLTPGAALSLPPVDERADQPPDEDKVERCSLCGELPDNLTVNTGREERFPAAFDELAIVGGFATPELRRCPECGTYFHWIDEPQFYGSGNCDEEKSIRLSTRASRLLDYLFSPDPQDLGALGVIAADFEAIPLDILLKPLWSHIHTSPEILAPFVPILVQLLGKPRNAWAIEVLSAYAKTPERAEEILEASLPMGDVERAYKHYTALLHDRIRILANNGSRALDKDEEGSKRFIALIRDHLRMVEKEASRSMNEDERGSERLKALIRDGLTIVEKEASRTMNEDERCSRRFIALIHDCLTIAEKQES